MNLSESPLKISVVDRVAVFFATGCGIGWIPLAPGTFGSLWGPVLFWWLTRTGWPLAALLACGLVFIALGGPLCTRAAKVLGKHDPGSIVYDEVAAFWIVYAPLLVTGQPLNVTTAVLGFVLFRLFDISKPWPCRRLEKLPAGWGIMADDLAAGAYSAAVLLLIKATWPI